MARRFRNTRRENRLEELGRVDAEKAYTSKGKRNLREEKSRIRKELAAGGAVAGKAARKLKEKIIGGRVAQDPKPRQKQQKQQRPKLQRKPDRMKGLPGLGSRMKRAPGLGKKVKPSPKKYPPKRYMKPLRAQKASGGRMKYASGGAVMAGKKVGCQIK